MTHRKLLLFCCSIGFALASCKSNSLQKQLALQQVKADSTLWAQQEAYEQKIGRINVELEKLKAENKKLKSPKEPTTTINPEPSAPDSSAPDSSAPDSSAPKSSAPKSSDPEFPWPPPLASATFRLEQSMFTPKRAPIKNLGMASKRLENMLLKSGYTEKSYYAIPNGFALVTRMEQINSDGSFKNPGRWDLKVKNIEGLSISKYLESLFKIPKGYFRVVAFMVTSSTFAQTNETAEKETAIKWLRNGLNDLPDKIAAQPWTPKHRITALVYEFLTTDTDKPKLTAPSNLTGYQHLKKAGLVR